MASHVSSTSRIVGKRQNVIVLRLFYDGGMEENYIVDLIDEEITRLREVQQILQALLPGEAMIAPVLEAQNPKGAAEAAQEVETQPAAPIRHVSRRGIATGRRGPRRSIQPAAPRPLDAAVPLAPVVVSRAALVVAKPEPKMEPAKGTLEEWVQSLRSAPAV